MRTTVRLNDSLLEQAKQEARKRGQTLTSLIELGLRLVLAQAENSGPRKRIELPVSRHSGGVRPGSDLTSNAAIWDVLDQDANDITRR